MAVIHEFKELLINLQHSDNEIRKLAETTYETVDAKSKFEYLLQAICDKNSDIAIRIFAGVLCRRLLDSCYEESFSALTPEQQLFTKQQLLSWIINEEDITMRKKICDMVVEIAKEQFDNDGNLLWQDLFSFVFDGCLSSIRNDLKSVGLHLFASLPHILGEKLLSHIDSLFAMFSRTMSSSDENGFVQSLELREASMKAFSSFIISQVDDASSFNTLTQIVPLLLITTADCIIAQPGNDTCLKALVELTDSGSDILKYSVNDILLLCNNILRNDNVDESLKHLAVEVFVSLSENFPAVVRKSPTHLQSLMEVLFKMLTDLDDDPDWATMDVEEEEDESSSSIVAEMALDRISCAMRGKKVLHEITHIVPAMLHSPKWQERHGGLMAISSCAEGLNKVMGEILGSIIDEIVPLLMDPHPRVRYAACNAVGQLSTDFGNKLQKAYHSKVLPALLSVLDDDGHPRVQAYAGAAMVNFCEAAPKSVLVHYLPLVTDKLLSVLHNKYQDLVNTGRKLVLEQIVTTVAAVADSVADHFDPYYDHFMKFLKFLMGQCQSEELRLLRGKTIECISLMGLAVGRDRFLADAHEVMALLINSQVTNDGDHDSRESEDPQHSYMISAWARMCKILGKDFAEFLPLVMKQVLRTASIKPDVCMMYNEEADEVDKDWQVVKIADDQNFAIHTSGLEDKATACTMLVCYARELTDAFCPYVLEVADIMIPLLKFYFNEEVRSSAADIMPHLLECSGPLGASVTEALWQRILSALLVAIPQEPYQEQTADMVDSVAECIKRMGRGAVDGDRLAKVLEMMRDQFEELFKNQDERVTKRRSEEYDEDDEERLEADKDEDDQVLCKLVDLMHALFQVYGREAMAAFEELLEPITRLMEAGRPWSDLQYGLCFWDDMIETMGEDSWRYSDQFVPVMVGALGHGRREIRQAAIYGFGLMAMFGGGEYGPVLSDVCPLLVELVDRGGESDYSNDCDNDSDDNNVMCAENAISALTKMYKYRRESLRLLGHGGDHAFVRSWLSWLPVWEDTEETVHVYGLLCDLVEAHHSVVMSSVDHDDSGLGRVVTVIVQCWHRDGMAPDTAIFVRCVHLVRSIHASDPSIIDRCLASLTTEEAATLRRITSTNDDDGQRERDRQL